MRALGTQAIAATAGHLARMRRSDRLSWRLTQRSPMAHITEWWWTPRMNLAGEILRGLRLGLLAALRGMQSSATGAFHEKHRVCGMRDLV